MFRFYDFFVLKMSKYCNKQRIKATLTWATLMETESIWTTNSKGNTSACDTENRCWDMEWRETNTRTLLRGYLKGRNGSSCMKWRMQVVEKVKRFSGWLLHRCADQETRREEWRHVTQTSFVSSQKHRKPFQITIHQHLQYSSCGILCNTNNFFSFLFV